MYILVKSARDDGVDEADIKLLMEEYARNSMSQKRFSKFLELIEYQKTTTILPPNFIFQFNFYAIVEVLRHAWKGSAKKEPDVQCLDFFPNNGLKQ